MRAFSAKSSELLLLGVAGRPIRFTHAVVGISKLVGSHFETAMGDLIPDQRYPAGIQARTYSAVSPDVAAYLAARRAVRPEMIIDRTALAGFGPPVVARFRRQSGELLLLVVAGNQRLMLLRHLFERNDDGRGRQGYQRLARESYPEIESLGKELPADWVVVRLLDLPLRVEVDFLRMINRLSDSSPVKARDTFALVRSLFSEVREDRRVLNYFIGCLPDSGLLSEEPVETEADGEPRGEPAAFVDPAQAAFFTGGDAQRAEGDFVAIGPELTDGAVGVAAGAAADSDDGDASGSSAPARVRSRTDSHYRSRLTSSLSRNIRMTWAKPRGGSPSLKTILFDERKDYTAHAEASPLRAPLLTANDYTQFVEYRNGEEQLAWSAAQMLAELAISLFFDSPDVLYEYVYWGSVLHCKSQQSFPGAAVFRHARQDLPLVPALSPTEISRVLSGLGQALLMQIMLDTRVLASQNAQTLAGSSDGEEAQRSFNARGIELLQNPEALAWLFIFETLSEGGRNGSPRAGRTANDSSLLEASRPLWADAQEESDLMRRAQLSKDAAETYAQRVKRAVNLRVATVKWRSHLTMWCQRYMALYADYLGNTPVQRTKQRGRRTSDIADLHFCLFLGAQSLLEEGRAALAFSCEAVEQSYLAALDEFEHARLLGKKLYCDIVESMTHRGGSETVRPVRLLSADRVAALRDAHRADIDAWITAWNQSST